MQFALIHGSKLFKIKFFNFEESLFRTLDEAFQDLRALMAKAQDMVQLAEKFREALASKEAESADVEMHRQLIEMGIASPVTKDTAGAKYHQQLSRQVCFLLASFLL